MDYSDFLKQYDGTAYTPKKRRGVKELVEWLFSPATDQLPQELKTLIVCLIIESAHEDSLRIREIKTLRSTKGRHAILLRDKRQCVFCGKHLTASTVEMDHDIPVARGGTDHPSNLQATCQRCNRAKGEMTSAEFRGKLTDEYNIVFLNSAKHLMKEGGLSKNDVRTALKKGVHDRPTGSGELEREAVVKNRRILIRYRIRYKRLIVVACLRIGRKPRA